MIHRSVVIGLGIFFATSVDAEWQVSTSKDEMTDEVSSHATSPRTRSTRRMAYPYSEVEAWLTYACKGDTEWVYIGFTEAPNLVDTSIQQGFSRFTSRVRWDDEINREHFRQNWGERFLHFTWRVDDVINRIRTSNSSLVELNWYGSGQVHFRFSLSGSSAAIDQARSQCRGGS